MLYKREANIDDLTVDGLRVLIPEEVFTKYHRSALSLHSVSKATVSEVRREPTGGDPNGPVVRMEDCRDVFLAGNRDLSNPDAAGRIVR